ncbi:outer membrane protein assembly factor BamE [Uliginosibacterium sp. 31-16]|uniref:outer membrane protein assembly factor BamE domain-containing protein n=1 Tax=Uliginosibacterium sp. 31-16 TaxID=3068315 RepID=UPI00273F0635|nr:outer membrane protein assembly factor BamE [Uliginosibacterium sp. 31-16]MDP5238414.1 outer membrane protein assembly factor BamE [Uliginosibacterium sp. 31-16]
MKRCCFVLLLSGVLGACAPSSGVLEPGKSALPQVLAQMGQPSMVWAGDNGALLMEFARVPPGYENFMARIGPDGVLISLRQVLTEESVAALRGGMTRDQVRQLLGRPAYVDAALDAEGVETWHWPLDAVHPPVRQLDVQFGAGGTVLGVGRSRILLRRHS